MDYSWDPGKAESNLAKPGVEFATVSGFDWHGALIARNLRHVEERMVAIAPIGNRLHVLVYTVRGSQCRVISLRKANRREVRRYEESKV